MKAIEMKVYYAVQGGSNVWFCLKFDHSTENFEQYFPLVRFFDLYKVVLTFESLDETLQCNHSYES